MTASADQVARVWDAATGLALATLKHDMDQWKAKIQPIFRPTAHAS